jgi:hypothetical protein
MLNPLSTDHMHTMGRAGSVSRLYTEVPGRNLRISPLTMIGFHLQGSGIG